MSTTLPRTETTMPQFDELVLFSMLSHADPTSVQFNHTRLLCRAVAMFGPGSQRGRKWTWNRRYQLCVAQPGPVPLFVLFGRKISEPEGPGRFLRYRLRDRSGRARLQVQLERLQHARVHVVGADQHGELDDLAGVEMTLDLGEDVVRHHDVLRHDVRIGERR